MADINGLDPVPFFIADQALHSADVVRSQAYNSAAGDEGVVGMSDFRVLPYATPTGGVRITTGNYVARGRSTGQLGQAYSGRGMTESRVDIPANTSTTTTAYHLVVLRIEDPQYAPWTPYATVDQKRVGPYNFIRRLPCTATTRYAWEVNAGHSAIALARVAVPPNTSAITQAMITDLRQPCNAQVLPILDSSALTDGFTLAKSAAGNAQWFNWPGWNPQYRIPTWANYVNCMSTLTSIGGSTSTVDGDLRGRLDFPGGPLIAGNARIDLDASAAGGGQRHTFVTTVGGYLPPQAAGGILTVNNEGRIYNESPGQIGSNAGSQMAVSLVFSQRLIYP